MSDLFGNSDSKGATFSECGKYRYALWRIWDEAKPKVMFIGLNPSTANAEANDAKIRRVITFAKAWGFGGVYMLNCFPYISTDPNALHDFGNTEENDIIIDGFWRKSSMLVFAWGNFEVAIPRGKELAAKYRIAYCLGKNKNGSPKHPLYIASNTEPIEY